MFVLLNGSFGIGKTTTAQAIVDELDVATIFDPEPLGIALQRASALMGPRHRIDDFQDVAIWRRLTALGARWRHRRAKIVIVPMAFSNLGYFEELADALRLSAPVVKLCLVAPLDVVRERLATRALSEGEAVDD